MPEVLPDNLQDLEQANYDIADQFAPVIYQLVEKHLEFSVNGIADLIVSVNYDNDWDTGNNWENLHAFDSGVQSNGVVQTDPALDPFVYYSVVWTNEAWVITYGFYHARDYAHNGGCCCTGCDVSDFGDSHENDFEGVVIVVSRETEEEIGAFSTFHNELLEYPDITSSPKVWIDNRSHAVELNLGFLDDICADGPFNCDDETRVGNLGKVTYTHSPFNVPSLGGLIQDPNDNDFLFGTGKYKLVDIFGSNPTSLFNKKSDPSANVFDGSTFATTPSGGCEDNGSPAKAPWGWSQMTYSDFQIAEVICKSLSNGGATLCETFAPDQVSSLTGSPFVVEHNPYVLGKSLLVGQDKTYGESDLAKWNYIVVYNGATLTIKNKSVQMMPEGKIILIEGGALKVENAEIKGCTDAVANRWSGIYLAEDGCSVEVTNNSIIKNSLDGITNESHDPQYMGFDADIFIENSLFTKNEYACKLVGGSATVNATILGSEFSSESTFHIREVDNGTVTLYDNTFTDMHDALIVLRSNNENIFINSNDFTANDVGIYMIDVVGVKVTNNYFYGVGNPDLYGDGSTGIFSADSRVSVTNNNRFERCDRGIFSVGTGPLMAGIEIGHEDAPPNRFIQNDFGIDFSGMTFPTGANVINNVFDNSWLTNSSLGIVGISEKGSHDGDVLNNTFTKNQTAIAAGSTGPNENVVQCNEMIGGITQDIAFSNDNSLTMFLGNEFDSPSSYGANVQLYTDAAIANQGQATNAAGNCFSDVLANSIALDNTSNSFEYFFYDQGVNCQEPSTDLPVLPYILTPTLTSVPHCPDGVGSGINGTGGTGGDPTSQDPPVGDPTLYTCTGCLLDSISHWTDILVATGGDDPSTVVIDPGPPTTVINDGVLVDAQYAEIMLDQWVNYALFVAIQSDNFVFGEQALGSLKKWKWQIKLYGLALVKQDYVKAVSILAGLPQTSPEHVAFHRVQDINIRRLTARTDSTYMLSDSMYTLTATERADLYTIGTSDLTCSGYARGLYKVLTGLTIPVDIKIPAPRNGTSPRSLSTIASDYRLHPNPSSDVMTIDNLDPDVTYALKIYDILGAYQKGQRVSESKSELIDVSELRSGLYFLSVQRQGGDTFISKFIVE